MIYFDNNATTQPDPEVIKEITLCYTRFYGNAGSNSHHFGWQAKATVEGAREKVAGFIGCEPREIIFTSGATESINIAIRGVINSFKHKRTHIISCETEHKAVLETLHATSGPDCEVTLLPVDRLGKIDLEQLKSAVKDHTILICLMAANNETGVMHPVADIGRFAHEKGIYFFCDATQAAGKIKIDVNDWRADLLCISAHKMYGPKGVGALFVRRKQPRVILEPVYTGGGQENNLRPGTLNVPGIAGLGKACEMAGDGQWDWAAKMSKLRTLLEHKLTEIRGVYINGDIRNRIPNTTHLTFKGRTASSLMSDLPGYAISAGSACTSAASEPSHVLTAMGLSEEDTRASIRISLSKYHREEEILQLADALISWYQTKE